MPLSDVTSTSLPLSTQLSDIVELYVLPSSPPKTEWLTYSVNESSEVITPLELKTVQVSLSV